MQKAPLYSNRQVFQRADNKYTSKVQYVRKMQWFHLKISLLLTTKKLNPFYMCSHSLPIAQSSIVEFTDYVLVIFILSSHLDYKVFKVFLILIFKSIFSNRLSVLQQVHKRYLTESNCGNFGCHLAGIYCVLICYYTKFLEDLYFFQISEV